MAAVSDVTGAVLRILSGVMPEAEVTPDSPLRDGGLNSLSATRLWFELRGELGVDVPVQWLGSCATVADLIARVAAETTDGSGPATASTVASDPAARYEPFGLTDLQQAYLVAKDPQFGDDPIGCHVYREFEVDDLDVTRLTAAWQRVVDRHDMLRAVVTADGRQRIQKHVAATVIGVRDSTADVRERLSHRRYEPGTFPMYSVEVSRPTGGPAVVHLSIDVLLIDGHGLDIVLDDWWRFYSDPTFDPMPAELTVRDCLAAVAAEQGSPTQREHLEYWATRLADLPPGPDLGPAQTTLAPGRRTALNATLSRAQWRAIGELATAWGVSPTAVVLTLFAESWSWQRERRPFSLVLTTNHRARLSRDVDAVVGPFTSSIILPVGDTVDRPLRDAAAHMHEQLWTDLGHASVSGVTALRRALGRATPRPTLPVVFTSLLGTGPDGGARGGSGFAGRVSYAISQTTGVALDHQMFERDGELHVRWDVVEEAFPVGALRALFAVFVNSLRELTTTEPSRRAMNELQQAYHVPRVMNGPAPWDGCQVYHAFEVAELDLDRLESAWLRLVGAYDVLRTVVGHDGRLAVGSHVPDRREIPVIDLSTIHDPAGYLSGLREALVSAAFPLGRGPQNDLRVTIDATGTATVHCTLDLNIIDGRSIHFLYRELFRLYADPAAQPRPAGDAALDGRPRSEPVVDYWRNRVAALAPGPRLPASSTATTRARVRREGRVAGWRVVRADAERCGLSPDDLMAAALTEVFGHHFDPPFSLPVVRWTAATAPLRPGEYTALSWITRESAGPPLRVQAAAFRRVLDADVAADAVSGLGELRKRVARERRVGSFDLPVVYTGLLDLREQPLPPGVRSGPWLTCTPDVSLDCIAVEEDDELRYYWDTVDSHFPAGLLDAAFAEYGDRLSGLVDEAARRRTMLYEWNDTDRELVESGPVHLLFEEQARVRPDAVALRWAGATMTYAELNRWANRIAAELSARGVGPEVAVGISVPRGPDLAAAVYGVLKAGGLYVPLEPSLPAERAGTIIDDAGISLVLTTAERAGWPVPAAVSTVDIDRADVDRPDPGNPQPRTTGDSTAYVIFTSGSTGKPKGVAVAHRPVRNLLSWCGRTHGFGPHDVGLCVTSLGFDLSVFDILGLLGCGASLYIANSAEQRDPELLLDVLLQEPVTFWNSAPTTLNQLAPLLPARRGAAGTDTLRLVYLSGDYTPLPLPDEVRSVFSGARIVSLGGATEATVWSNWYDVGAIDPSWRSIPYGKPIDNARYHVLDEHLEPCPVGVEGDLYIGGDCLALGYYRQPELTAQRFIRDPFSGRPDARLYATGDRALYYPDGNLSFQGRADGQVKIRGFRVELGEVEHRLRAHPDVKDAVVMVRADHTGDRKLVGYVVPAGPLAPSVSELRRHAAAALPDYMVPNVVTFVDTFPATSNGKLDRDGLPWPVEPGTSHVLAPGPASAAGDTAASSGRDADPSAVDAERLAVEIAQIFADVLGVSTVDIDADVWDQGATSFTMVQVSAVLAERHGRRVPVSVLLADPTVRGIARALGGATVAAPVPAPVPEPSAPSLVDFFDPVDRDAFKRARWDLRTPGPRDVVVALDEPDVSAEHFDWRASHRQFDQRPLAFEHLSKMLGLLRETTVAGRRRRLYPSAGDTYAVQVYLHVKPGAVEGVPAGLYYHHPVDHALHLVNPAPVLDRTMHFVYNRPVFDSAGIGLYLFGQVGAIEPVYGADSERFLLLEAGYLGQLLMLGQAGCGIGLCPVGTVSLDPLCEQLGLDDRHRYLQAFLGGPVTNPVPVAATGERPLFVGNPFAAGPTVAYSPGGAPVHRPAREQSADIAVIGAAGRFPDAPDLDAFWRNLSRGARAVRAVPDNRRAQVAADATGPVGGYLDHIDTFDALLFHVAPADAGNLDPQLRLLLHTVWECLENAGHGAVSLNRAAGRVGVFLGAMWHDHQHAGADGWRHGAPAIVSATASEAANRISHFFDFRGPSVAIDTSCSSSLAAVHLAAASLRRGECDAAVVAAANLLSHPYHLALLDDLGLLASQPPDGAFDGVATGWSPGEGVAAVLLRPQASASRDGDTTQAIVEACRIGHFGGTGRFGTPNAGELAASITATLAEAGLITGQIGYVECAAAGAVLADAAELEALGEVFAGRDTAVPVGTLKPNIGHLEAAAGLSQVLKVMLQLRHRQIAPTLVSSRPNPLVPTGEPAVSIADRLIHWAPPPDGGPLRAVVNAVGATGSYGHVVLRAPDPDEATGGESVAGPQVAVLSAETPVQLATLADRLRRYLVEQRRERRLPVLADIAYTLQTGRASLTHRLAVTCTGIDELVDALAAFVADQTHPALATGTAIPAPAGPARPTATIGEAAQQWLAGRPVDWAAFWPAGSARRVPLPTYPFAEDPYGAPAAERAVEPSAVLGGRSAEEYLLGVYAELSGVPVDRLDPRVPLEAYGLTSLLIARLNERLAHDLGEVSRTLFFEHPDLAGVAAALPVTAATIPPSTVGPRRPTTVDTVNAGDAIAVVGIAGRYPQAPDLDAFWRNLLAGRDAIGGLPPGRARPGWPVDLMVGGYIDGVDEFDPLFFGITPREAALMDPQERLFLQTTWHALEDAGYTRDRLHGTHGGRVGVFVGSMYNEYPFFGLDGGPATGSALAGIANRVSYFLDLHGPSLTVDTMCSSSLTAIHLAVTSLRRHECALAIAGGVNLSLHPNKYRQLRDLRMASSDHRCRSFGAGGDGFVPGEGVGAVLLKRLADAIADGDRIQAVIRGTAVNHDGKTNGYTVPNPVAQGTVIVQALRDAGVPPESIGYLEAHGTGTALGDPIEINGLTRAFQSAGAAPAMCAIGSVKSSIGHLEAAAGIAGLTKVVLQMRHGLLAPSIHADELNPNIDWAGVPFRVQRTAAPWREEPRRAGISSFGAGGTNGHIVVESYVDETAPPTSTGSQLVVLSARTTDQLRELSGQLAAVLGAGDGALPDVAYTLQVGREAMRERLAVTGEAAEMRAALERFASGDESAVLRGRGTGAGPAPAGDTQADLARHWVDGGTVDWPARYPVRRRLVGLPGYPFARMRCWATEPADPSTVDTPLLVPMWEPAPDVPPGLVDGGLVLCLYPAGRGALARAVAAALRPATVLLVDGADPAAGLVSTTEPVTGWLDLCALPNNADLSGPMPDPDERDDGPWQARLAVLQELLRRRPSGLRVLQVTSGLLDQPGAPPTLRGARLAGFVRSLGAEYPWARSTVLDVDGVAEVAAQVAVEWRAVEPQAEICVRAGVRYRRRLVPAPPVSDVGWRPDPDRVYVVTGGTRGLGALVARHLVARGARRLAVLGRRTLPPRHDWARTDLDPVDATTVANIQELERLGARVMVHSGQLTDTEAVAGFLTAVRAGLGDIAGVVHCAGRATMGPTALAHKSLADIRQVLQPKGDGLDALMALTAMDRLDAFLLFSSVSSAVPALAAGVADYAAANAYLDYAAGYHRRVGRTEVRAVNWPVWRETGGGTGRPDACAGVGLDSLSDDDGLAIVDRVLAEPGFTTVLPAPALPGQLDPRTLLVANRPSTGQVPRPAAATAAAGSAPADEPATWLVALFAEVLGIPERQLDTAATFGDLGVESVLLAELVTRIEGLIGRPVEPTALLEHPTLRRLSAHLSATDAASKAPGIPVEPPGPAAQTTRVAVIGMACRMPGGADLDTFWRLLREGRSAVSEVPPGRWDAAALYRPEPAEGHTISRWGGFVDGVEDFDPEYFGISDEQARDLDPAIRMMLEGVASCLADAGYDDSELRGRDIGVFVGARMSGYRRRIGVAGAAGLGGDQNFIAAQVAHSYDLCGPNLVVDSACSSALVAVQLACNSVLSGESELAFAGGVEVLLDAEPYLEFSAAKALSPRGRCATFARDADGFVPGEGCGVLLFKRLDAAVRDGDRIHAVIDAVAVGNDGHTMGLTTPNPRAQAQVVRRALHRAGRRADDIGMVEAHGTATMIGDPIELRALTDVYREQTDRSGFCAIGSVKSNVGHLLSAAGMAGLVKTLLALEHGEIPPTLFCDEPNPRFDFAASPFFPNTRLRPWPPGRRAAGVSAFGLGGTNAHLIATAYDGPAETVREPLPAPLFRRRRLWWDRPEAVIPAPADPGPESSAPLVATVLDLNFQPVA